jgi:AraC-like DNA-binding protein
MELVPGYREFAPPLALRGVVSCLWVRVSEVAGEVRVVPDGSTDVVWERGAGVTVVGPDTTPKLVRREADDVLVGIRLQPGAGGAVLGLPLGAIRDQSVDVAEVSPTFALDPDSSPQDVVGRLLAVAAGSHTDPLIAEAARRIAVEDVRSVARDLWISERQLRRRFHAAVGYGPKMLERVMRFRCVVDATDSGQHDLVRVALDAGYADQAHMTREIKRLSGLTPSALIKARAVPVGIADRSRQPR